MNKEITIYELLGLIKDGQAPKRIIETQSGGWKEEYILDIDGWYMTIDETTKMNIFKADRLNNKVKIIEEDNKIKKIKELNNVGNSKDLGEFKDKQQLNNHILKDKINELIDEINALELIDEVNTLKENNK